MGSFASKITIALPALGADLTLSFQYPVHLLMKVFIPGTGTYYFYRFPFEMIFNQL